MSQGPLCPNLTQKFQKEVSQIANCNLPRPILLGGLSVNLNHLKNGCSQKIKVFSMKERSLRGFAIQFSVQGSLG